jgi:uncharacterized cupin superfamily protein
MQKEVKPERPSFIRNWREIERAEPYLHEHTKEEMVRPAPFSRHFEIRRIGIRHDTIEPGWRSSNPHAERDEEEMVFILEGTPDLWSDGFLYRMKPGEAAGWPGRDGMAHCLINNTDKPVRMLTVGEASRYNSTIYFPTSLEMEPWLKKEGKLWADAPARKLGPHDGLPDAKRGRPSPEGSAAKRRPSCVVDWKKIKKPDDLHYDGDDELMGIGSPLTQHLGLMRIGVWHDCLLPGRRTSWPHAEADEEEFVYVLDGEPDAWIDGHLHRLREGDGVGFPSGTGISHVFINNTQKPVRLIVVGEASRRRSRCYYPKHSSRNKAIGVPAWPEAPERKLGPHDGLPDAIRNAKRNAGARAKRKRK